MPESTKGRRVHVKVSTTSKGIPSFDASYEVWDAERSAADLSNEAIGRLRMLYDELESEYGALQDKPLPASAVVAGLEAMKEKKAAPKPHVRVHPERTFATTQRRLQFLRQDGEFDVYLYDYEAYLFPLYYPATYEEEK